MISMINYPLTQSSDAAGGADHYVCFQPTWDHVVGTAKVVWSPDGHPMRHIAPRSHRPVGRYNSRKAGRMLHHESRGHGRVGGEKLALMRCEVDPEVRDFRSQHVQFQLPLCGTIVSYVPDVIRLMVDGGVEVIEVKADLRWRRDSGYAEKLDVVARACRQIGWSFSVWTDALMAPTAWTRVNIVQIQMERFAAVDEGHELIVAQALRASGGSASMGHLVEALGSRPEGGAFVRALMCRGLLSLPLDQRIGAESIVTIVETPR